MNRRPIHMLPFSLAAAGMVSSGCQLVLSSDKEQCSTREDCVARGGAFESTVCLDRVCVPSERLDGGDDGGDNGDPKWGCVGNVSWPAESLTETITYRLRLRRLTTDTAIQGLRVLACRSLDPGCLSPAAEGTTDANGEFVSALPRNFRGYLHMKVAPESFGDMLPTIYAMFPPPDRDSSVEALFVPTRTQLIPSRDEAIALTGLMGTSLDPNLGYLSAFALDCGHEVTAGITLNAPVRDPKTVGFYQLVGGLPSVTARQTDATGIGGFINLPPATALIEGIITDRAQLSSRLPILIQPGVYTLANLPPSP